jgi:hypothetical protein
MMEGEDILGEREKIGRTCQYLWWTVGPRYLVHHFGSYYFAQAPRPNGAPFFSSPDKFWNEGRDPRRGTVTDHYKVG